MTTLIITREQHCPFCEKAKAILEMTNTPYEEKVIGVDLTRDEFIEMVPDFVKAHPTVPQIWMNGEYVGGCSDLEAKIFG